MCVYLSVHVCMHNLYNVTGMHMNLGLNIWYCVNNLVILHWRRVLLLFSALVTSSSLSSDEAS